MYNMSSLITESRLMPPRWLTEELLEKQNPNLPQGIKIKNKV